MLFFGHRFIKSQNFYHLNTIEAITKTPPSSTLLIEFHEDNVALIKHASANKITFALQVKSVTELLYASALQADYIIVDEALAKIAQNIAESYLFDAKILVHIEEDEEIEELALLGLDGVIFSNAIIKVS